MIGFRNRKARAVTFNQRRYGQIVAGRFDVRNTSVTLISLGTAPLSKGDGAQTNAKIVEMRNTPYREALGTLMWITTMTRPNLSFAAHNLVNYRGDPEGPRSLERSYKGTPVPQANGGPRSHVPRKRSDGHEAVCLG